jgi:hypothetical protein
MTQKSLDDPDVGSLARTRSNAAACADAPLDCRGGESGHRLRRCFYCLSCHGSVQARDCAWYRRVRQPSRCLPAEPSANRAEDVSAQLNRTRRW